MRLGLCQAEVLKADICATMRSEVFEAEQGMSFEERAEESRRKKLEEFEEITSKQSQKVQQNAKKT